MGAKKVTADEAALIAGVSSTTIRRRLVPVEVVTKHIYNRGTVTSYFYASKDAEALRDGRPVRARKHPDPILAIELSEKAKRGAQTASVGREVKGAILPIVVPGNTPACCRRHALNHVRHEGTNYDDVVGIAAAAYHRHNDATTVMKSRLNERIEAVLAAAGKWPEVENCGRSLPVDILFARGDFRER
jgi:hypothetical protein